MQIDEPRRDNKRRHIDNPSASGDRELPDSDNPVALDGDISPAHGGTGSVNQRSTAQQNIRVNGRLLWLFARKDGLRNREKDSAD
jgi:hypothetical protein